LGAVMLELTRREARLRIVIYLALFILLRDTMTPLGLWSFGSEGFFWIRLHGNPLFLIVFGVACLGLRLAVSYLYLANLRLFRWTRGRFLLGLLWGMLGAILVVAPVLVVYQYTPVESRGGTVSFQKIPALLVFALLGNLLEESLFRGYVYGWLVQGMT